MNIYRHNIVPLILLLGLLLPAEVYSQLASQTGDPVKELQNKMTELRKQVVNQLHLTSAQREELSKVQTDREQNQYMLLQQLQAIKKAMKMELMSTSLNKKRMQNLHNESKRLLNTLMDIHFESLVTVREILQPNQIVTLQREFEKVSVYLTAAPVFPLPVNQQKALE